MVPPSPAHPGAATGAAQGCGQLDVEHLQGQGCHNTPGQFVLVSNQPQNKIFLILSGISRFVWSLPPVLAPLSRSWLCNLCSLPSGISPLRFTSASPDFIWEEQSSCAQNCGVEDAFLWDGGTLLAERFLQTGDLSPCPEQSHLCSQDWAFMALDVLNGNAQVSPEIALTSRRGNTPASSCRNVG